MNPLADRMSADTLLLAPQWVMLDDGPAAGIGVLVQGGRFADVAPLATLAPQHPGLAPVELPHTLLMPGFIDAHHHLTQSLGKALAFGEPSEIFRRIWVPLEASLDADALYLSAKLAALEALRGGFTTVCDAGTRAEGGLDAIAAAVDDAGLRCVLAMTCNDAGREADAPALLREAQAHLVRWSHHPLVHPSLAISVPEAGSDAMLGTVAGLCGSAGRIFQVHVNEHLASVERSLVARGLRPLEHLDQAGALGPHTLVAHATLVTPYELQRLRETDTAVSYNPVASTWKGNAVANAQMMAALGIRFGLGTDGTRSDGFRLMDAAETLQRIAHGLAIGDSSCGGGWMWLDHATACGASAVGLGGRTGEIAAGQAADFLLVDLDVPEMKPSWDLTWELVRLAGREQLKAVFVDGRLRLWQGWPPDWDAHALMREVDRVAEQVLAKAPIQRVHATADAHRRQVRARGWRRGPYTMPR
jgi:5-methylthioadenosine/S-adenosylhomocysteine deaminase